MYGLRPFKNSDARIITSWVKSKREFFMWSAGRLGDYPLTINSFLEISDSLSNDTRTFWMVACEDEVPFGFIQLRYPTEAPDIIRFGFVIINPELRGQGYGKLMLKAAINYAFNILGIRKITLGVFDNNTQAYRAYVSVGFSNTNSSSSYFFGEEKWTCNELVLYSATNSANADDEGALEEIKVGNIIKNNEFLYAFQPIVNAHTGDIYAYEALMRAESEGTNVPPSAVLGYAAKYNKLYEIEKATLFNVMDRYENCLHEFKDRKVFINSIPGYQLKDEDYKLFKEKYSEHFKKVLIEITEMTDFKDTELDVLLKRSADDGFGLAVDDYGTGFSNTSSLLRYLPNCVKLDRLLISNINEDTKKQHFVKGMVEFAHANGFRALAEGVETSAELRTVIDIGIDLIQGFYTARPSFEIIDEINEDVRSEIINVNHKTQTADTRKIFVVTEDKELPLMRLSLEQYTGMLIATEEFTLIGNTKYCAEMSVKIKDGCKCRLTIRDVFLESFMQLPCIELGNKSELTLVLEGENRLRKLGIFVPKDSKLNIEGEGNLQLRVQGIKSYGIGSDYDSNFGSITWNGTGSLDILVEADEGIGIGGGHFHEGEGISIMNGIVRIEPACSHSVAIGCAYDNVPIKINNANIHLDLKTESGIGIGCGSDKQNTVISSSKINIICAGTNISGIGSNSDIFTEGGITLSDSELSILGNGQRLYLVGAQTGAVNIKMINSLISLKGEGNEVTGIGSADEEAIIFADHTTCNIKVSSGLPRAFGAKNSNINYIGGVQRISVNE